MKLGYFLLGVVGTLFSNPQESYFDLLKTLNLPNGDHKLGEVEIVTSSAQIKEVATVHKARLLKNGYSEEEASLYSQIGIVAEDPYWIWIRDAVLFPKGIPGTYDRLIWKSRLKSSSPGVAVMPILPDGKIVLNLNYRHATRSWELELPRGARMSEESHSETALRELKEETGLSASSVYLLGEMAPDSGTLDSIVPIFIAFGSKQGLSEIEYSEAIHGTIAFTKDELKEGFFKGFIEVEMGGEKKQIPLRDSFLAFALLQAEIQKRL